AQRATTGRPPAGVVIREAVASDSEIINQFVNASTSERRFSPRPFLAWPDSEGLHRAWLAFDTAGRPLGGLIVWDGASVRQIRVVGYSRADNVLRMATRVGGRVGLLEPLPNPGGVLRLWASRWFGVLSGGAAVARALVNAAIRTATNERLHV